MENNGWTFPSDIRSEGASADKAILDACGSKTWYGWSPGNGKVSATFVGSGTATLDYGNCWIHGTVNVYLNGVLLATSQKKSPSQITTFTFSPSDVLSVEESGHAVIKLNSLMVKCRGNC